ncbi:MAG TPA: VWA domain-containing protein [Opitutaceae bacterium]|nr:VWA domain-containing protein [Opitutaceae bacterium]
MSFGAPEWFFVLPALAVIAWRWRGFRLHEPLRALSLFVLVLALAEPRLRLTSAGLDLWVLADRSDSAAAAMTTQAGEFTAILERAKRADDRLFFIDYAGSAVRRDRGDPVYFDGSHQTRTGAALEFALGQLAPQRAARVLALTDGYATDPLGTATDKLLRSGVALDYRFIGESVAADWRVAGLIAPPRVLPGEAFMVEFVVMGQGDSDVPWEMTRNGQPAGGGVAAVRGGIARVRLGDRLNGSGAARYEVRLKPKADAHPENNVAGAWVEITGGPRVVLVSNYADDPLAALLSAQGLTVELVTQPNTLTAAKLTGARLVVINNVPASRLPRDFLGAIDFFVREQGGGLLMAGGENSFGSGGYFASAIDELLPVSMELKKEQRKFATAMAIVMDRSGSMGMNAGAGLTKMDLANTGAARAVELLGDMDAVSVHAVDTQAHAVVELAQVGPNRNRITEATRRVVSGGGGIYVYEGLVAGWGELKKAKTGTKHMILFADANDSPHSEGYLELLKEMRDGGATVSVIGLGSEADHYAPVLKDIAERGGGRFFFNADANELPAIFAQETVSVARSAFIKEPTPAQGTPGWAEIAARPPQWLPVVDGYNLSYLREGATASLIATDEYQAPLVATWSRGAGRVAAVSFPLGGPNSEKIRAWSGYGDFAQTLSRWLGGEDAPAGLALRPVIDGAQLTLDLLYDETWTARLAQTAPVAALAEINRAGQSVTKPLTWEKIEPGRFRATTRLEPDVMVRGAVRVGAVALPFGPLAVSGSAEWNFDLVRRRELQQLSTRSGGRERLDLATIWDAPRTAMWRPIQGWLLIAWGVLFLTDATLTRIGLSLVRRQQSRPGAHR